MVPGQHPRLYAYTLQNCKHTQTHYRARRPPEREDRPMDTPAPCLSRPPNRGDRTVPFLFSPITALRGPFPLLEGLAQPPTLATACSVSSPTAVWPKEPAFCAPSHDRHKGTQGSPLHTKPRYAIFATIMKSQGWERMGTPDPNASRSMCAVTSRTLLPRACP